MATRTQAERGVEPLPARLRTAFVPLPCVEPACGTPQEILDESDPLLRGWVAAGAHSSPEPPRWYCSPQCAARGVAPAHMRLEPAP